MTKPRCPCHEYGVEGHRMGWQRTGGPYPLIAKQYGIDPRLGERRHWMDHMYRRWLATGGWEWLAEPYEISPDDFADLAFLEEHGLSVSIRASDAMHNPGRTLVIGIRRPPTPMPSPRVQPMPGGPRMSKSDEMSK